MPRAAAGPALLNLREHGETPVFYAARLGRLKTLELLLDAGADVSVADFKGRDAVDIARSPAPAPGADLPHAAAAPAAAGLTIRCTAHCPGFSANPGGPLRCLPATAPRSASLHEAMLGMLCPPSDWR
ncbi:hypothetical protein [Comamonas sp. JC664]|uniref:hypothetical protein n=1 Tax=Comamonas sp. JC664 TaxID=2801917 RepID=UPI00361F4D25